jgi:hypothetical protein
VNRNHLSIAVFISIAFVAFIFGDDFYRLSQESESILIVNTGNRSEIQKIESPSFIDLKIGTGEEALFGKNVVINMKGYIEGITDDQNIELPISFKLGEGALTDSFDELVLGMKEGSVRVIWMKGGLVLNDGLLSVSSGRELYKYEISLLSVTD